MKALVDHLLTCNREQILSRSLMHCHAHCVHSIMLLECPGKTIRLFVAEPGHLLGGNNPIDFRERQSVGFHAHHCELTLVPTTSSVWNWTVEKDAPTGWESFVCDEFQYQSAITHGKIGFEKIGSRQLATKEFRKMHAGEAVYMDAEQIHTVYVPSLTWGAWFALEGRENPAHDNHCWSMSALDKEDFSGFYKPMAETELERLLAHAFSNPTTP